MKQLNPRTIAGPIMIVAGGIVGWLGWEEKQSVGSALKSAFTGSPSDKAIWMLAIAAVLVVVGVVVAGRSMRR